LILGLVVGILAFISDLSESLVKRAAVDERFFAVVAGSWRNSRPVRFLFADGSFFLLLLGVF